MTLRNMLQQTATIKRLRETDVDGAPIYDWVDVADNVPCFADTYYARGFRRWDNPNFVPEAQRADARRGQLDTPLGYDIRSGDRVVVSSKKGVLFGTFEVGGDVSTLTDRQGNPHHLEMGITEVSQPLGRM